jgi:UDP-N-acetylglucosamine--N-acetylmuramyl-(pentapeptide) pyrophosphoryl-undecaprenol N-acetylglucosamine transferase
VSGDVGDAGPRSVVLAGGGTAGHIEPAMNLADALRHRFPHVQITALGTERGLEVTLVPARGYDLALIPAVPFPRRPSTDLVSLPTRLRAAIKEARRIIDVTRADVVVGFGGYVALPAYFGARQAKVPIIVHEANARPGLANRIGARMTRHVLTSVAGTSLPHAVTAGLPLRPAITDLDRAATRAQARRAFGLLPDAPTLLVFGGSQGARRLNDTVAAAAAMLRARGVQILHAVGPANEAALVEDDQLPPYVTVPFIDHMDLAYAAADVALCRAGAMTCAELTAVGLPAIYVPLPIGNGEQRLNAAPVVAAGGGVLVDDADLTAATLVELAGAWLTDPRQLAAASSAAAALGRKDAGDRFVDLVVQVVGERS